MKRKAGESKKQFKVERMQDKRRHRTALKEKIKNDRK